MVRSSGARHAEGAESSERARPPVEGAESSERARPPVEGAESSERARPPVQPDPLDRILTIPTVITFIRLLCLPLFLYLLFGRDDRANAAWLLGALGATDWVDGYLARRLGQVSEFGKKFDPTVDRLLFIVAIVGIIIDGAGPVWFLSIVLAREVLVGGAVAIATVFFGMARFDVTFLGKCATLLLMFAVPGFMLGYSEIAGNEFFEVASWILAVPGLALSLYTAAGYASKIRAGIVAGRATRHGVAT